MSISMALLLELVCEKEMSFSQSMVMIWKKLTIRHLLISLKTVIRGCGWWCCLKTVSVRWNSTCGTSNSNAFCREKWQNLKDCVCESENSCRVNGRPTVYLQERRLVHLDLVMLLHQHRLKAQNLGTVDQQCQLKMWQGCSSSHRHNNS